MLALGSSACTAEDSDTYRIDVLGALFDSDQHPLPDAPMELCLSTVANDSSKLDEDCQDFVTDNQGSFGEISKPAPGHPASEGFAHFYLTGLKSDSSNLSVNVIYQGKTYPYPLPPGTDPRKLGGFLPVTAQVGTPSEPGSSPPATEAIQGQVVIDSSGSLYTGGPASSTTQGTVISSLLKGIQYSYDVTCGLTDYFEPCVGGECFHTTSDASDCTTNLAPRSRIQFRALTNEPSDSQKLGRNIFVGWEGCPHVDAADPRVCLVDASQDFRLTARFTKDPHVQVSVGYAGTILPETAVLSTQAGLNWPADVPTYPGASDAQALVTSGTQITLTATPGPGQTFSHWEAFGNGSPVVANPCAGSSSPTCTFTALSLRTYVTAVMSGPN
jgi:hypothetical protein